MSASKREIVFENEIGLVYWDEEIRCVVLELNQCTSSRAYRAFMERVLKVVRDRGSSKFLADMSRVGDIDDDDLLWTETDWLLRLSQAGVRHIAVVRPKLQEPPIYWQELMEGVDPTAS